MDPNIAHITDSDGMAFQILNSDGTDWDEAATRELYNQRVR
jgi:hypothetical protein